MTASTIWRCWAALMLLLAATTASAFVPLGSLNIVVSLVIAVIKALVVLLVFMELRASRLVRAFAAAGFFWLLIMIVLTGADYWHRTDARAPIDRTIF